MTDKFDTAIDSVINNNKENTNLLNPSLGSQSDKVDVLDLAIDKVLVDENETKRTEFLKGTEKIPEEHKTLIADYTRQEVLKGKINLLAQYDKSPDELAVQFKKARSLGLKPAQLIDLSPETEKLVDQTIAKNNIKVDFNLDTPTVYSMFDDALTAKISQDSIVNLQSIEYRMRREAEKKQQEKEQRIQSKGLWDNFRYGQLQLETLMQAGAFWAIDQFSTNPNKKRERDWRLVSLAQDVEDRPHDLRIGKLGEEYDKNGLGSALRYGVTNLGIVTSVLSQAVPSMAAGGPVGKFGTSVASKVVQNRISNLILRNYLTKTITLGTIGSVSTASMSYQPNLAHGFEKTKDPAQALDRAQTQTSIDSAWGFAGGALPLPTMLTGRLRGRLGNVLNVTTEATAQSAAGGFGAYYSAKAVGDEISNGEIFVNTILGFITTPADIAVASLTGGKQFNQSIVSNLETTRAVIDEAKNMALTARDPETAKQVIARIKKQSDSPIQDVYLPSEEFSRYFQEQGIDPATLADKVTGKQGALDEALATGADLQIPLENYAVDIAIEHDAAFADTLRTAPDSVNLKEIKELQANQEQLVERVNEAIKQGSKALEDNRVYSDVFRQLTEAGREKRTAEREALVYSSVFNTLAERLSIDSKVLYDRYKLKITRDGITQPDSKVYSQNETKANGFIEIDKNNNVRINLTDTANLSTVLHESGHFFLNVLGDVEAMPEAKADIKEMNTAIKKWLKAKDLKNLTTDQHEKFARGFEAYLMEGKAPSVELQGAFTRFKVWVTQIYKTIKNLNVRLNDDVRRAFDRMLATDDAIEIAKAPYREVFTTAEQAGMTEREFNIYREEAAKASAQAKDKLLADSLKEITNETKDWWRTERAKIKEVVTREVNNQPVYRVIDYLNKGLQEDRTVSEPVKLDRNILIERYGKGIVKELRGLTAVDGVNPESVSMMWGFSSSDEMIKAVRAAPNRNALINAETDARMRETHGDILNDGTIAEKAINSVEAEGREQILLAEQKAIKKQLDLANKVANTRNAENNQARNNAYSQIIPNFLLKKVAENTIAITPVNKINPSLYRNAEIKANKEAFNAASKKDWETAARAKEQERLNNFLYREAIKARDEATKIYKYINGFDRSSTRKRIGKTEGGHLEQIDALREQYEFKQVSNRQLERRKSLAAYVREQQEQGNIVAIDQAIIDNANQINYRQLTFAELQGLNDAIKNIETIATLKNKLRNAQGERDYQTTKDELITQLNNSVKIDARKKPLSKESRSTKEALQDVGASIDASLIRMEHLINNLDADNVDGIFHQVFWNPLADAVAQEKAIFKADMMDIMKQADKLQGLNDKHYINSIGRSFTTRQLMMVALNAGNESNRAKLLKGGIDGLQLTDAHLADLLAPLTKDKWDFVQEVWSKFDNRWPDIAAMYKRLSGVEPKAVEATPVITPYGEYKGGYFPIIYDRSRPNAPDAFLGGELFNGDFEGAMPSNGFTNARNENVSGPLKLEIGAISQHMMMQIHDLTHREALQNAYRLAKDRDVRNALINKLGSEQADLFIRWLKNIANDANPAGGGAGATFINAVRNNTSIVGLGFSTTTMLAQAGGIVPVIRYAGAKDFAGGLIQLMQSPLEIPRFIMDKSPAMRTRWDTSQSKIEASFDRLKGKNEFFRQKERVVRFAFDLLNYIDRYITGAGWLAAYNRALREGKSEAVAIYAGDAVVRKSQGGFNAMDKASIQYGDDGKVMAMFTMFYTPFSAFYNQGRDLHFEVKNGVTSKSKAAAIILATAFFQGVVGDLLTGQGPDDDENLAAWMGKSTLGFATSGLPIVRDVVSSWTGGRVYSMSPLAQSINKVTSLPITAKGIAEGKEGKTKQAIEATGLLFGIPVKPLTRQGDALYQIATDEYNPEDASGFVKALIYGVRKKDKQ